MNRTSGLNILAINWQDIRHPLGGGAEVHFHEIFKRVVAFGHRVTLLCSHFDSAPETEWIDGIRVVRRGRRNGFNWIVPRAYRELSRNHQYDVVVDDINKIPFYTPLFVKEPVLAIVHHLFRSSIYVETFVVPATYVYVGERLIPYVYRKTPFAVVSRSTRKELSDLGIRGSIDLLPNGVDPDRYPEHPEWKDPAPLVGYVGRLKRYKRIDQVIRFFPRILDALPEARLVVVGDGDHRAELEHLTRDLGLEQAVRFTGHVSHEEKARLLNQMWVAVNPSSKEGWGLTVIEANACGIPVVAADSPGLRDSVVHNKTGFLYPGDEPERMVQQVLDLLTHDKKRQKFGRASREWAETFRWDDSARTALALLQKTIKQ
jgi:glycosyltransferase involved in cell wall biosynthesis